MTQEITIGKIITKRGEKIHGCLPVPGTDINIPITIIHGQSPGKTVVILSGIHGGEYLGIEVAIRLATSLQPDKVNGIVILAHPVNTAAFFARQQYIHPGDGKNLNRVFPGKADGTVSEKIAYTITNEMFRQADFVMDLHGGDLHEALEPFMVFSNSGSGEVDHVSEEAAKLFGIRYLIGLDYSGTTFGTAAQMRIPGFLAELGQSGEWSDGEVISYMNGVQHVLKYLEILDGELEAQKEQMIRLAGFDTIKAEETGCWYPSIKPGETIKAGKKIGEIRDFFSNVLHEYHADQDGIVLVLLQALAVNAQDPIFAIGRSAI